MLGSHIPLYVFDAVTANLQREEDEVLEAYVRFLFWVLSDRTAFLWPDRGIYQQDIAECHTTDSIRAWFKEHQDQFIVLPCPENSPDLNPINNLWNHLDRVVRAMDPHARNLVQQ
ncbi:transposable element Tcb1 transposase [Trichonephila clavipes]|nr:transposable element Tcb1 transposase [Trichonephila clavipes]